MGRKLPPPIILKVEGISQAENGDTFVDDFTGEVLPRLKGEERVGKTISGNEADLERHRLKRAKQDAVLKLAGVLPTRAETVGRLVTPTLVGQRPIATLEVNGKPIALYIPSIDPIRRW